MRCTVRWIFALAFALALFSALSCGALAQNFYGEGNVLIAVDMGHFQVNEGVHYPEGTMGTLVWGEGAATGTSTRPAFASREYTPTLGVVPAEEYAIETVYEVGQTLLLPFLNQASPEDMHYIIQVPAETFPEEVLARGEDRHLAAKSHIDPETGGTIYDVTVLGEPDGTPPSGADFLEMECVAVTERCTLWQYTGNAYSTRPDFDPAIFGDAVFLSEEELKLFEDTCEKAYLTEGALYGDPRWVDARGDRDGKIACMVWDFNRMYGNTYIGYVIMGSADFCGFDHLNMNADCLPARWANKTYAQAEEFFKNYLCHELNHYILDGCLNDNTAWLAESFAQNAVDDVRPGNTLYLEYSNMKYECTQARIIIGMLWGDEWAAEYPPFHFQPYILGHLFFQYVERWTTGETTGALWTEFFAEQTPGGVLSNETLDAFLQKTTGEGLEAWMAQFMAALITGDEEGQYAIGSSDAILFNQPDLRVFLRDWHDYGQNLTGFDAPAAADHSIGLRMMEYGLTAVSGGGTTFAYRNDAGGPISITGADDRWYFFAVNMELPDLEEVIEISSAEELKRIGHDPDYPLSGRYLLTADIDLCGSPENPWTPIGRENLPFIGEFDGNGRTIEGLYIDSGFDFLGLFGMISGNAVIRDLTVKGSVTGGNCVGGIVGYTYGGTVTGCTSYCTVKGVLSVGGIVGYHYVATLSDCAFFGTVKGGKSCGGIAGYSIWAQIENCHSVGDISGDEFVGGIVGFIEGSTVERCYHTGSVSGGMTVGGASGWIKYDGIIRNCYHIGPVSGEEYVGSVAGGLRTGTIENCYSLFPGLPVYETILETATLTSNYVLAEESGGENTLTAEEFTRPENFVGWDFENVWSLENSVRPILRSVPETIDAAPRPQPEPAEAP